MYILPFDELTKGFIPLRVDQFEERVSKICSKAKHVLVKKWVPECANVIKEMSHYWIHLIPKKPEDSIQGVKKFFTSVAALMSMQMRTLVMKSLEHFCSNLMKYEVGGFVFISNPNLKEKIFCLFFFLRTRAETNTKNPTKISCL